MTSPIRCRLFLAGYPHDMMRLADTLRRCGLASMPCPDTYLGAAVSASTGRDDVLVELFAPTFDVTRFFRHCQTRFAEAPVTALVLFDSIPSIVFARVSNSGSIETEAAFSTVLDTLRECGAVSTAESGARPCGALWC